MEESSNLKKSMLKIQGMHCPNCVGKVTRALTNLESVIDASVDLSTNMAKFAYNPEKVSDKEIIDVVKAWGFEANFC